MKTSNLLKRQSYTHKLQNHSSVCTMSISVWPARPGSLLNVSKRKLRRQQQLKEIVTIVNHAKSQVDLVENPGWKTGISISLRGIAISAENI